MAGSPGYARVLLDSPLPQLDRLFDYRIPEGCASDAVVGARVRVPLRSASRIANGYIVELIDEVEWEGDIALLDKVVSPAPVLAPEIYRLARQVADRQIGVASDVIRLAVPGRQARVEKAWLAGREADAVRDPATIVPTEVMGGATGYGTAWSFEPGVNAVHALPGVVAVHLVGQAPAVVQSPSADSAPDHEKPDNEKSADEKSADDKSADDKPAVDAEVFDSSGAGEKSADHTLANWSDERPHDGSGDGAAGAVWVPRWAVTVAERASRAPGASIVCVADYRDVDALVPALEAAGLADRVVRLDAKQSNADRYRGFLRCFDGDPVVVVGNRSAVYAPVSNLALVTVVNDGDPLFSEPLAPYPHTREVALMRAADAGCALDLVSVARSVETERLVELGHARAIEPERQPSIRVIPTADQPGQGIFEQRARIPSTAWQTAKSGLESGPVLVQVAHAGYARTVVCDGCGEPAHCTVCGGRLTVTSVGRIACALCGAAQTSWRCRECGGERLRMLGTGSRRTAEELGRGFPGTLVRVSDGERPIERVGPAPALIVATKGAEPIADGGYRAVLLLDGEAQLARESVRVVEDLVRSWSLAVSLAADRAPVVITGVSGPIVRSISAWRQQDISASEWHDRRALSLPPATRIASIESVADIAEAAAAAVRDIDRVSVLGPISLDAENPGQPPLVRYLVRFPYAEGAKIASILKDLVVRNATARRRNPAGRQQRRPALRIRCDRVDLL